MKFADMMRFARALAEVRTWKVPIRVGSTDTHVTVTCKTPEEAVRVVKTLARGHGAWKVAASVAATEHPAFAKPDPHAPHMMADSPAAVEAHNAPES